MAGRYVELKQSNFDHELEQTDTSYSDSVNTEKVLFAEQENLAFHAAVRRWPRVTLYSLGLTTTIILWGYDGALIGSVAGMPEFKKVFGTTVDNQDIIPAVWLSLWNVAAPIGGMFGAIIAGWLGDKVGRKWTLGGSTLAVGISVTGLAIGTCSTITQTYMSEVVPNQLKASVLATFPIFQLVGQIIGSIVVQVQLGVEGRSGYRIAFATQYVFGVPPLVMSLLLPESPVWLLRKGRVGQARTALHKLESSKRYQDTSLSFKQLQATIERESKEGGIDGATYLQCLKGTDLRRTLIIVFAAIVPDMFGLHLVGNATYFLQTIGISAERANLIFIAGIAACLVSIISSWWTLAYFRRRILFISTLSVVTGIWGSIGIIGSTRQQSLIQWYTCITFVLLTMTAGLGVWPASYVVGGETSALRLRAKSQGIGWLANGLFSVVIGAVLPLVYNPDAGNLGAQTGFVYFGLAGIATAISFFYLPEMKGRKTAEIDEMFELRLSAREFKKWRRE